MEQVHGKAKAVQDSPLFTGPRQKFLAERLRYWEDRIAAGKLGGFLPTEGE